MKEVPNWIYKFIEKEKLSCNDCNFRFKPKNLVSIGIQISAQHNGIEVLAIGLFCSKCKELVIFEIKEMSLEELAMEVLDQEAEELIKQQEIEQKKSSSTARPGKRPRISRKTSSITNKDIKDTVMYLNSIKTNEEFLLALGMSPEEIDSYNIPKKNRKKKNDK